MPSTIGRNSESWLPASTGQPEPVAKLRSFKDANEALQRRTRQLRAEGALPPHEPSWFSESIDPDSQERLWLPKRAENGEVLYWSEREHAPETKWDGVDRIFVEE